MNVALKSYNKAIDNFNAYIDFKNHQFSPLRPDEEMQNIIPDIMGPLEFAEREYLLIINEIEDDSVIEIINSNLKQMNDFKLRVVEEKKFVDKYLSTKKNKRRDLFFTKIPG